MNSDGNNFNKKVHKREDAEADLTEATPLNPPALLRIIDTPSVHSYTGQGTWQSHDIFTYFQAETHIETPFALD